jgi:predicted Zn-dependent protease
MATERRVDAETAEGLAKGITAALNEEYLTAFTIFSEIYREGFKAETMEALSFYALSVALVNKKYKDAIELGRKAVKAQPFNAHHHINLAKIYVAAGNRKKAVEVLQKGLATLPESKSILAYWKTIGIRSRPVIPFLSRDNPLNVMLGQKRATAKREKASARRK